MCLFHDWQYLFSNPPSIAMAMLYDGKLDLVICTKCGKTKRTCLYLTNGQKWVDRNLRPIEYMGRDWTKEEWEKTVQYTESFPRNNPNIHPELQHIRYS